MDKRVFGPKDKDGFIPSTLPYMLYDSIKTVNSTISKSKLV